jgi:hypothetical protein
MLDLRYGTPLLFLPKALGTSAEIDQWHPSIVFAVLETGLSMMTSMTS